MKMSATAVLAVFLTSIGCASMNQGGRDRPVGTTGTTTPDTTPAPAEPTEISSSERGVMPVGQEIDVRLQGALSSATATTEQRFQTTTVVDITQDNAVLVPAGSVVRGVVSGVKAAGNIDRTGSLTLAFDQIVVKGREFPIRAMATQAFESGGIREEARTVGTAGAVGAIVGGIIRGLRGALIGAAVGSGGVIAATEGKNVELPAGTIIRIRLDSPARIR
ncbi:MAG: hypothetical protein ACRD15_09895 [Vicinamibacterales bacterium]